MKYLLVNKLKPENVEQYSDAHRNCWPEMRQALTDSGAKNCTTFVMGNMAYLYYECDDLEKSFRMLGETETNKRWNDMCLPWFETTFELNCAEMVFDLNN